MPTRLAILIGCWSFVCLQVAAQDVLLQGYFGQCSGDSISPAWADRLTADAPELAVAGFTYLDLRGGDWGSLYARLTEQGIQPVATLSASPDSTLAFEQPMDALRQRYPFRAFRLVGDHPPKRVAAGMDSLYQQGSPPTLLVGDPPSMPPAAWVAAITSALGYTPAPEHQARVYDHSLKMALVSACTQTNYDVRQIFNSSLRDKTALSGFNTIVYINAPNCQQAPLSDPLLAYAYLLTNNQVGLPAVLYQDYRDTEGHPPLEESIDQLIRIHQDYIYGATAVDYLNRIGTDRAATYEGTADSTDWLLFQLDGTNTPTDGKDVLVGINFSNDTLRVRHEINTANVASKDYFTDVTGNAPTSELYLQPLDSTSSGPEALEITLLPRSYAIWVQGSPPTVAANPVALSVEGYEDYIEVSWEITSEQDLASIELERSVNGRTFQRVVRLSPANEDRAGGAFLYLDEDVFPSEQMTYRVKLIAQAGGSTYSALESARLDRPRPIFELMQAPGQPVSALRIQTKQSTALEMMVVNTRGQVVLQAIYPLSKGATSIPIRLEDASPGVYFVRARLGSDLKWWTQRLTRF